MQTLLFISSFKISYSISLYSISKYKLSIDFNWEIFYFDRIVVESLIT